MGWVLTLPPPAASSERGSMTRSKLSRASAAENSHPPQLQIFGLLRLLEPRSRAGGGHLTNSAAVRE